MVPGSHVVRKLGQVMYEVEVGRDGGTGHRNQLRKRLAPVRLSTEESIPLDIPLVTFNLPVVSTQEEAQRQVDLPSRM